MSISQIPYHLTASGHYTTRGRMTPRLVWRHMRDVTIRASSPVARLTRGSTREDLIIYVESSRLVVDIDYAFVMAESKVRMQACTSRGAWRSDRVVCRVDRRTGPVSLRAAEVSCRIRGGSRIFIWGGGGGGGRKRLYARTHITSA